MLAAVALSACENTPDNIRSNKHSAEVDSGEAYVSPENIYDSFDAAFEKEYTKFKLPEKSAVSICKPDGVYDLELAYINAENDMDWLSSKVEELQSALDIKIDGKIETVEDQAQLQDEHNKLKITRFAQPYCCWEASENGVNTADADADNMELFYLDRPTSENADSGLLSAANKAKTLADTFSKVLGEELDNVVSDGYVITTDSGIGYEIEIQKAYKGIGIQNVFSTNADDTLFVKGNALMTYSMQTYTDLDANFGPEYYIGCNAFKVAKAEKIDKMLSFKGACDLLEENLADKIDIQFDDVKLMYEPRGESTEVVESADNICCTPKWYFIIDDKQPTGLHAINYVTVDCVTGEIYVLIP